MDRVLNRWHGVVLEERFLARTPISTEDACWRWTGLHDADGYGTLHYEGRMHGAHRIAYALYRGEIPKGIVVRHKCDVRDCVNPSHLELGTQIDNIMDMVKRGRHKPMSGENNGNFKVTDDQLVQIQELKARGMSNVAIGKVIGVCNQTISKILRGKRNAT
jgi:hypothetical protein